MNPNDVVVHCASAQSVTLSALGGIAWWTAFVSVVVVGAVTNVWMGRNNEKEREEARERVRSSQSAYEREQRQYENEREDLKKLKAQHEREYLAKLEELNARAGR
jgi:hypothetical protein